MELSDVVSDSGEAVALEAADDRVVRPGVRVNVPVLAEPEEREPELVVEEEDATFDVRDALERERLPVRPLEGLDPRARRDAASLEQRAIGSPLRVLLERASKGG